MGTCTCTCRSAHPASGRPVLRGALGETPDLRHPTSFQADPIPLRKSPHYRVRMTDAAITIVPANEASWEDLQAVLGTRGDPSRCQCQRYKMQPGESWASVGAEELALRLRAQTDCGHPAVGHDERPRRLPRRRARRLVRGRAAHRLSAPAAQDARPLGGPSRGQGRRQRLGGDLLRHPRGFPAPRRQPCARARCRRVRA